MKKILKWLGLLFLAAIVVHGIKGSQNESSNVASSSTTAGANPAVPSPAKTEIALPVDEEKFVRIIQKGQDANKMASNDMQKGGARAAREKDLCTLLAFPRVSNWIGDVYSISSNSEGKGVLELLIAPDVYLKTWNNAVSDAADGTLIDPGSILFNKASQLREGQKIKFSGSFLRDSGDSVGCLSEGSLTLDGKLSEPEFLFRFSDVSPL